MATSSASMIATVARCRLYGSGHNMATCAYRARWTPASALCTNAAGTTVPGGRMDLGIAGRSAIVCASSQGLGLACATALAQEGVDIVLNGRNAGKLEDARHAVLQSAPNAKVRLVAADLTTADGREALIAAAPQADILVTNNAGPP